MSGRNEEERQRLAGLRDLSILDSDEERSFDRITEILCLSYAAPIALITVIDADRAWFKSKRGLDVREVKRSESVCAHAMGGSESLVIEDVRADGRFKDNPLIMGPPFIRFYAGAPLRLSSGLEVGSVCVIDTQPRERPSEKDLKILENLAATVSLMIEQRNAARELRIEIARRREAEREASAARDAAEAANLALRSFFSKVSHDLRTPLGAILGYSQFLSESDLPREQMKDVEEITDAGRKLLKLVDQFLVAGAEALSQEPPLTHR